MPIINVLVKCLPIKLTKEKLINHNFDPCGCEGIANSLVPSPANRSSNLTTNSPKII